MKYLRVQGLGLSLALLATGGYAQEATRQPANSAPATTAAGSAHTPVATLGRPVAARLEAPRPVGAPVASLAKPMPTPATGGPNLPDVQVQTASFFPRDRAPRRMTVKGEEPIIIDPSTEQLHPPQPLPVGTPEPPLSKGAVPPLPPVPEVPDVILSPGPAPAPLMPGDATFNQFCDVCGLAGCGDVCGGDGCCGDVCGGDGCCGGGDKCCCDTCCDGFKCWVRGEYLMWWMRDMHAPPLVTTSPQTSAGVIGQDHTSVVFGGPIDFGTFNGGRFNAGFWLDDCQTVGLEGTFFFLAKQRVTYQAASDQNPLIARPFFDVLQHREGAQEVSNQNVVDVFGNELAPTSGQVLVSTTSRLWGAEANGLFNLCSDCNYRVYGFAGFRYLDLQENLAVGENVFLPVESNRFVINDQFGTHNHFYGGQLGMRTELYWHRWQLDLTGKCALGDTHQVVNINGQTVFIQPNQGPQVFSGGLLTGPGTNIGIFTANRFSVVPEVGCNIGYQVTDNWRVYVGYNLLYWTNVARAGDQIDRVVNTHRNGISFPRGENDMSEPKRPAPLMASTDILYHGANAGIEFRY